MGKKLEHPQQVAKSVKKHDKQVLDTLSTEATHVFGKDTLFIHDYLAQVMTDHFLDYRSANLRAAFLKIAIGVKKRTALTAPSAGVGREEAANAAAKEYAKQPKTRTPISLKQGEFNSDYKQGFLAGADWHSRSASQPGVGREEDELRRVIELNRDTAITLQRMVDALAKKNPSLPRDGVQGLVEALEKIANGEGSASDRMVEIKQALTAYKNANPC